MTRLVVLITMLSSFALAAPPATFRAGPILKDDAPASTIKWVERWQRTMSELRDNVAKINRSLEAMKGGKINKRLAPTTMLYSVQGKKLVFEFGSHEFKASSLKQAGNEASELRTRIDAMYSKPYFSHAFDVHHSSVGDTGEITAKIIQHYDKGAAVVTSSGSDGDRPRDPKTGLLKRTTLPMYISDVKEVSFWLESPALETKADGEMITLVVEFTEVKRTPAGEMGALKEFHIMDYIEE